MFDIWTGYFSNVSLLITRTSFFSISFGPISILIGIPSISDWDALKPTDLLLLSIFDEILLFCNNSKICLDISFTFSFLLARTSIRITLIGAILGGITIPLLSPWPIIIAPIDLVDKPQDVW